MSQMYWLKTVYHFNILQGKKMVRNEKTMDLVAKLTSLLLQVKVSSHPP